MKLQQLMVASLISMGLLLTSGFVANAYAVSSSNAGKVKDFNLKPTSGKSLRKSDIALAIRARYEGVRPRISKRTSSGKNNCYDVKFLYKNELKRVSFNCTATSWLCKQEIKD